MRHEENRASALVKAADPGLASLPERGIAHGQDLVEQDDRGIDRGGDGECQPGHHAGGVGAERQIDELSETGELNDLVRARSHRALRSSEKSAVEEDVLAAAELVVKTCSELDEGSHGTADDCSSGGWG